VKLNPSKLRHSRWHRAVCQDRSS